jgi:hypothetical protein
LKIYKPAEKSKEPSWTSDQITQLDLIVALNWYNSERDAKDARKYLVDFISDKLTEDQKSVVDSVDFHWHISDGWIARCISRGCVLPEKTLSKFEANLEVLIQKIQQKVECSPKKQVVEVVSLQERTAAKIDSIIGEIEGDLVDTFGIIGSVDEMNAYQWMVDHEVKAIHASKIADFYQKRFSDLESAVKDADLREYYSGYSKKQLLNLFKCYGNLAADAKKIANNAKISRKPRAKKAVSLEKRVAGLKFKIEDTEFKIKSIDPVTILAAEKLFVFNTKTRKLGLFVAATPAGLSVKGTTIENIDISLSVCKTLRKPKDVLSKVLEGGKITLRKVMDEVNSKSATLNGRINKDVILLRAVKS